MSIHNSAMLNGVKRIALALVVGLVLALTADQSNAAIVNLMVTGNGGNGLLESNVTPGTGSAGEGGIGMSGITLDTTTNILHVDVNWGTGNGYSGDLSGVATLLHLHGPTPSGAPNSFSETGPLMVVLSNSLNFNDSAINGGVTDDYFINSSDIQAILDGRTYINVHTDLHATGEIRGYLVVQVPEPAGLGVVLAASAIMGLRRKRG